MVGSLFELLFAQHHHKQYSYDTIRLKIMIMNCSIMNNTSAGGPTVSKNVELKTTCPVVEKDETANDGLLCVACCCNNSTIEGANDKVYLPQHHQIPLMEQDGVDTGNPALNRVITELWDCLKEQKSVPSKDCAEDGSATSSSRSRSALDAFTGSGRRRR